MNVFVIGTRGFPGIQGGVEKHCEELYPRLVSLGIKVTVFVRSPYFSEQVRPNAWKGIDFIYVDTPRNLYLEALVHSIKAALICIGRRRQVDLVHVHNIGPALCIPLLKLFGLKTLLTYHSPNYEHPKWGTCAVLILKLAERIALRFSDAVITLTAESRAQLAARYKRDDIHHIPNGVTLFEPVPAGEGMVRWGLQPKKYVLAGGRFVEGKGFDDLIAAFRGFSAPGWRLVIAGDADHETAYSKKLRVEAVRDPRVVLTGFVTGKPLEELYSNAGLFVLPSHAEGLPLVLLEALSCGLPVLASDIPASHEIPLGDERYFPPGAPDLLAAKLSDLAGRGISDEARGRFQHILREEYGWTVVAQRTAALMEKTGRSGQH